MKEPLIKPKNKGKIVIDQIEYTYLYSRIIRLILRVVKAVQKFLWQRGVAIHDPIFGECTPDFNCCCSSGKSAFIKIPQILEHSNE